MEEESTAASSNGTISPTTARACGKSFTNVNPDLVIFLGAYDTNYDWSDARRESVRYTADLTNLLSAYAFKPKWSFCVPVFRSCLWPVLQQRYPRNGTGIRPKAFRQWRFCREKISAKAIVTPERWTRGFCASIICMIFHGKERPTITHVSR